MSGSASWPRVGFLSGFCRSAVGALTALLITLRDMPELQDRAVQLVVVALLGVEICRPPAAQVDKHSEETRG